MKHSFSLLLLLSVVVVAIAAANENPQEMISFLAIVGAAVPAAYASRIILRRVLKWTD